MDKPKLARPRPSRTDENVESVRQSARETLDLSIRKRVSALNKQGSSLHHILLKNLCLHLYKIQLMKAQRRQSEASIR